MKTLTKEEVKKIVENHKHWINRDCDDWQNMKADFTDAYIGYMDLSGVNLSEATFCRCIFDNVDLSGAKLWEANFEYCKLYNTGLQEAFLMGSEIRHTTINAGSMKGADFTYSHIRMSEFQDINMKDSKFINASIRLSWFCECYMGGADFSEARIFASEFDKSGITHAKNWPSAPMMIVPDTGSFIGWKKAYDEYGFPKIVCLEIPEDAKRSSGFGRKCRCDKAKVIGIYTHEGTPYDGEVRSMWDKTFVYRVGQMVTVDNFDEDRFKECSPGIHFFITRQEAVDYIL